MKAVVTGVVSGAALAALSGVALGSWRGMSWLFHDLIGAGVALIHLAMVFTGSQFGKHRFLSIAVSTIRLGILGLLVFLALRYGVNPVPFTTGLVLVYIGLILGMVVVSRG